MDRITLTAGQLSDLQAGNPVNGYTATALRAALADLCKDAADLSDPNPVEAQHVISAIEKNFPLKALSWVSTGSWIGPVHVPLSRIDFRDEDGWAASHEPGAVRRFAKAIKHGTGHTHPVILVQSPEHPLAVIVDGHHRTLACRKLRWPVKAYLGTFKHIPQAAYETHAFQIHSGPDPANKSAKVSKESVDYRPSHSGERRCGTCIMYRDGMCTLVAGNIDPDAVCDRWSPHDTTGKSAGNAETLREYWTHEAHPGPSRFAYADQIRWGQPGDFDRCTALLMEHGHMTEEQARGYCNLQHHRALGYWPAQHAAMGRGQ